MDARVVRTQSALQDALLQLARDRPLDEISVADITDQAGVNRSTFYQHYSDKETLLADALDAAAGEAAEFLPDVVTWSEDPPRSLAIFLSHVDANPLVYRRALGRHGSAIVTARLRDRIEALALSRLAGAHEHGWEGMPDEVVSAGLAGAALGVIEAWLRCDPRPPVDTAALWMWRMITGPQSVAGK